MEIQEKRININKRPPSECRVKLDNVQDILTYIFLEIEFIYWKHFSK